MPRTRRSWGTMRSIIRQLLRETDSSVSEWTDAHLLDYWNLSLDMRSMQLAETHEGWISDLLTTNIVADQGSYTLEEGTGRIRRVRLVRTVGETTYKLDLIRDEQVGRDYAVGGFEVFADVFGLRPTYRLLGELLLLEPPPTRSVTNGLEIELDNSPLHFDDDADKLDLRFPVELENLLIYDVVELALGVEDHMGNASADQPSYIHRFQRVHRKYEAFWDEYIQVRAQSRVFTQPMYLGD